MHFSVHGRVDQGLPAARGLELPAELLYYLKGQVVRMRRSERTDPGAAPPDDRRAPSPAQGLSVPASARSAPRGHPKG